VMSIFVMSAQSIACPQLGAAQELTILGASTVTNTGTSVIDGSIGLYPGTAVEGFPPGIINNGAFSSGNVEAQDAALALSNSLIGLQCTVINNELGGQTLVAGVYCLEGAATLAGTLTLDGASVSTGVWVFLANSTLTGAGNSAVTLINGATACNIFWTIGTSATFGGGDFKGVVIASQSITMTTTATLTGGRLFALNAAITLDTNTITTCFCNGVAEPYAAPSVKPPTSLTVTPGAATKAAPGVKAAPGAKAAPGTKAPSSASTIMISASSIALALFMATL